MNFLKRQILKTKDKIGIINSNSKLVNSQWITFSTDNVKTIYSFLDKKRLIISRDGNGFEAEWEFFVDSDTIIIKENNITVYNCTIIFDEFMALNKDNTNEILLFANTTKYKNISVSEIENNFTRLFEKISNNRNLCNHEKLFIIRLYEIHSLLLQGKDTQKVIHLLNRIINSSNEASIFSNYFNKLFGVSILSAIQHSKFNNTAQNQLTSDLLSKGIITKAY